MRGTRWLVLCGAVALAALVGCSGGGVLGSRQEPQQPQAVADNAALPQRGARAGKAADDKAPVLPLVRDVALRGGYAYALVADALVVVDLSAAKTPEVVARLTLAKSPLRLALDGDNAAIACGAGGLQIVRIAKPRQPLLVGSWAPQAGGVERVAADDGLVAVGLGPNGLALLDDREPGPPQERKTLPTPRGARELWLREGRLSVLTDAVTVLDVRRPTEAKALGSYAPKEKLLAAGAWREHTALWGASGLTLLDLSAPERPNKLATVALDDVRKALGEDKPNPPAAKSDTRPGDPPKAEAKATDPKPAPSLADTRLVAAETRLFWLRGDGKVVAAIQVRGREPVIEGWVAGLDQPTALAWSDGLLVATTTDGRLVVTRREGSDWQRLGEVKLLEPERAPGQPVPPLAGTQASQKAVAETPEPQPAVPPAAPK